MEAVGENQDADFRWLARLVRQSAKSCNPDHTGVLKAS